MDRIDTLELNVIEGEGRVTLIFNQGVSTEDGRSCARGATFSTDIGETTCCHSCWLSETLALAATAANELTWKYYHTEACGHADAESADA